MDFEEKKHPYTINSYVRTILLCCIYAFYKEESKYSKYFSDVLYTVEGVVYESMCDSICTYVYVNINLFTLNLAYSSLFVVMIDNSLFKYETVSFPISGKDIETTFMLDRTAEPFVINYGI